MVDKNRATILIVLFIVVALIVLVSMQNTQIVTVQEGFIKDIKEFGLGEKITFYEVPEFLTPEQEGTLKNMHNSHFLKMNFQIPTRNRQRFSLQR